MSEERYVYHITTRSSWHSAQAEGVYRAESLERQGFIHLSRAAQVYRVANALYRGATDLVLLTVDTAELGAALRYEPADPSLPTETAEAELFPHLYSTLPIKAVIAVQPLVPKADGSFGAD